MEEYKKGDIVKAKVLDVDVEKERISLGIKQVGGDPMETVSGLKKGAIVTGEVTQVMESGIEVKIADSDMTAFIRRAELSRERSEQRPDRFAPGEKVDARVTNIDKKSRKISLSIKALEIAEEKEAVAQYGSTDSGASLGDILGAALKKQQTDETGRGDRAESKPFLGHHKNATARGDRRGPFSFGSVSSAEAGGDLRTLAAMPAYHRRHRLTSLGNSQPNR